ncbi:MAG TPA: hypothetical protein VMC86_02790, partial [Gemmatimonadales bacterium]|nr:hypothetical protein [Gemmatimonadales bacterium]
IAVVVLGGGGYALFGRGHAPAGPTGAAHDTTTHQTAAVPTGGDTTKLSHPDTTHKTTPKNPGTSPSNPGNRRPAPSGQDSVSIAAMADRLADMTNVAAIIDTGTLIYNASHVSPNDRAFAACAVAQAYKQARQMNNAIQWANRGLQLKPDFAACKDVLNPGAQ